MFRRVAKRRHRERSLLSPTACCLVLNLSVCLCSVLWLGIVLVPGGAGGFLLGSIVTKRMSLTSGQQLRAMFFLAVACLTTLGMFSVQCDTAPLAGESSHHNVPPTGT